MESAHTTPTQGNIWAIHYKYNWISRHFESHESVYLQWDATDLQISRIEFSPMAKKGYGVLYGWTHEVYCTCPHRVTWRRRDGTTAFDLETYTAKAGRRQLEAAANEMMPAAAALYSRLCEADTADTVLLTKAFTGLWKHNT